MGCLLELLLLPFEALMDFILDGWISLMLLIIPRKRIGKGTRMALKILINAFCILLLLTFLLGVLAAALTDATVWDLRALIFVPLSISVVQILIGAILRIINRNK